ncbi:hypothetical protein [Pseudomonas zhanjiangensis]|uniref:Uncharacterized protein n=1 Tax=Pseudomonas zhanjiangensis TaxID=3239015 RepID=A0ABV3YWU5_9PSED
MLKKYDLPKLSRLLLAALFLPLLYSMYLAGFGPFELSLLGALASLPIAVLLYRLDVKVKFLTHDSQRKRLAALAIVSFCCYFTFSGYIITRGVHELIAKPNRQTVRIGPNHSGRRAFCKYSVGIQALAQKDYCASKNEYDQLKIDSITWRTTAWLVTSDSPLGSTIASIQAR